jgi:hypothetical protein
MFHLNFADEATSLAEFTDPLTYLYEPNAAILKAGGFNSVARCFEVGKIAPNTHLYTSDQLIADFPGRVFKVETRSRCPRAPRRAQSPLAPAGTRW